MRLPVIKHALAFAKDRDEDYLTETVQVLEHMSESTALKDDEINVLGEMISNLYGAIEVLALIKDGKPEKEALNTFMKRVVDSVR